MYPRLRIRLYKHSIYDNLYVVLWRRAPSEASPVPPIPAPGVAPERASTSVASSRSLLALSDYTIAPCTVYPEIRWPGSGLQTHSLYLYSYIVHGVRVRATRMSTSTRVRLLHFAHASRTTLRRHSKRVLAKAAMYPIVAFGYIANALARALRCACSLLIAQCECHACAENGQQIAIWIGQAADARLIRDMLGVASFQLVPTDYKVCTCSALCSSLRSPTNTLQRVLLLHLLTRDTVESILLHMESIQVTHDTSVH